MARAAFRFLVVLTGLHAARALRTFDLGDVPLQLDEEASAILEFDAGLVAPNNYYLLKQCKPGGGAAGVEGFIFDAYAEADSALTALEKQEQLCALLITTRQLVEMRWRRPVGTTSDMYWPDFRRWVEARTKVEDYTGLGRRIQVKFQDSATPAVPGWEKDTGMKFAAYSDGLKYGWKCGAPTTQGRIRQPDRVWSIKGSPQMVCNVESPSNELLFHLKPRPAENTIVMNIVAPGWGLEERIPLVSSIETGDLCSTSEEVGVDYPGNDESFQSGVADMYACSARCAARGTSHFTYGLAGEKNMYAGKCWCKRAVASRTPLAGVVSGKACTPPPKACGSPSAFDVDTDYNGNDESEHKGVADPIACSTLCAGRSQGFFTFFKQQCWCKRAFSVKSAHLGAVSGRACGPQLQTKGCEPSYSFDYGQNYLGNDHSYQVGVSSAPACARHCAAAGQPYFTYGLDASYAGGCWCKRALTARGPLSTVVSGRAVCSQPTRRWIIKGPPQGHWFVENPAGDLLFYLAFRGGSIIMNSCFGSRQTGWGKEEVLPLTTGTKPVSWELVASPDNVFRLIVGQQAYDYKGRASLNIARISGEGFFEKPLPSPQDLVWDFEDGTLQGFEPVSGNCGEQPRKFLEKPEMNWAAPRGGRYYINTFFPGGDGQMCTYRDKTHSFVVGAGTKISWYYSAFRGKVSLMRYSDESELQAFVADYKDVNMQYASWDDLSRFAGVRVYLQFSDTGTGPWEHIQLDNIEVLNPQSTVVRRSIVLTAVGRKLHLEEKSDSKDQQWSWTDEGYLQSMQTGLVVTQTSPHGLVEMSTALPADSVPEGWTQTWTLRQ